MRSFGILATLVAFFAASATSQQYAGEVIDTSLPNVPGSEIAFFKIPGVMDSNKKKAANLTLINYMSRGSDGKRLVGSKVQRAVIIIHGLNRDPGTYESNMLSALAAVTGDANINKDSVAVMSPYFANGDDKRTGYPWTDGLTAGRGSTTSALVWKGSQWSAGGNNQYPYYSQATSSYTVLDTIVQYFDDRTLFPNMKQIVVAGHSLGAQTVHRYAALGQKLNTNSPVTYWVGNPNSYVWLSTDRPLSTASCPTYDYYRDGYTNFTEYPMTYGQSLVSQGRSAILANYNSKQIAYARGTQDNGDDSSTCAPGTTGGNRNERFFNFIKAFPISCPDPRGSNCDTVDLVNMGHDGGGMFASPAGRARLFTDNFYGNGNRSYDFGYPRQQDGDDPFPDPTLNMTSSSLNNNTYAGNLTYAGCWSDSGSSRTLPTQAYDNSANTIELCTSTCVSRGFSIAGLEFGSQCYCGNAMTSGASKVIESSCIAPCAGNSSESCGGSSRLSVFSNGTPYVLPPASNPETVGKFYFSNCYTETSARTLPAKSDRGSFMTLDYCANFCSGYKYFGTEYGSECYCGNTIDPLATIAPVGECGMTCANNTIQYCGAGNRLSLYTNPDWVQPTGSSTSSAPSTPTASDGASGLACPAANNTVVTSNGLKFIVECGIDHSGGDLTSVGGVSFQQCIDACSSNSQCVDVSLSGSACYLKKTLGSAVNNPAIWGAKLVTDGSGTTSTSSSASTGTSSSQSGSSSSLSSSSGSTTSSATSTSASSTPSDISCPASDATTYTSPSGQSFIIECGIDHAGGDMGMKSVSSFQQCIDACDQTTGCVDVSLSGSACYLKSTLGAAGKSPSIWGAKLIIPSVSSTSSGATSSSSAAPTSTDVSSSSSSTSSGASATPTAVTCPGSNGTLYAVASGNSFLIECGIDHQGGDLSSKDVKSFADCIAACDTTANCVDISMVGSACYLKNAVGPAVKLDYVWGAKLVVASPSSSSLTTSATTTSSSDVVSSSSASSTSASDLSTSSSTSSSSSSSSSSLTTTTAVTSSDADSSSTSSSSTLDSTTTSVSSLLTTSTLDSTTSSSSAAASTSSGTTDSSLTSSWSSLTSTLTTSTETTSSSSSSSKSDISASSTSSTLSSSTTASQTTISSITSSTPDASSTSTGSTSSTPSSSMTSSSSSVTSLSSSTVTSSSAASTSTDSISSTAASSTATSSSSTTSLASSSSSSTTPSSSSSSASSSSSTTPLSSSTTATSSSASGFTTSVSSTTISSAASSATAVLPAGFSYAGCFIDGSTRALPISVGTSTSQTQQQCAMTCQTKGYKYSGTEYAQECWCGNSIPSSPASESQCSMACKGDSTQKCGAGNRLSVVSDDSWKQTFFARQSVGAWNLLGCYTDSTAKRSLPASVSLAAYGGNANATIANCVSACQAKGFAYCGAEYYSECYGSNVAPTTNLAGSDPLAAGCNYPCKGNSTESCGGSARIVVYSINGS